PLGLPVSGVCALRPGEGVPWEARVRHPAAVGSPPGVRTGAGARPGAGGGGGRRLRPPSVREGALGREAAGGVAAAARHGVLRRAAAPRERKARCPAPVREEMGGLGPSNPASQNSYWLNAY